MPELPEVETIRQDLEPRVVGRRFTGAEVLWARTISRPDMAGFGPALAGRTVVEAGRRGKYLLFVLADGATLVVHLRMTGRLRWKDAAAVRDRHVRAVLHLEDGGELHFEDQRKFGRIYLAEDAVALARVLANVGQEPLANTFDRRQFAALLRGRHTRLKPLLLDQRVLAGLGNIYADEALYRARLHPLRQCHTLTSREITRLHQGIVDALEQGLANRGTTLSTYRDAWGTAGHNQERLLVFRHQGQPCPRCGTAIAKLRVAGRGTHICPRCQPAPRAATLTFRSEH